MLGLLSRLLARRPFVVIQPPAPVYPVRCPVPPTPSPVKRKDSLQSRVLARLQQNGSITAWEVQMMGTTDARKLLWRLRKEGHISSAVMETNQQTGKTYKRYFSS